MLSSLIARCDEAVTDWCLGRSHNIADLRRYARLRIPRPMWGYLDGGADDEVTLARNNSDFANYDLLPRCLVDVGDVYMTFFLPEMAAGRVALGSEVRIVLDAAQAFVIPARVSYVASVAQFTPKTVETQSERQKMVFRVKARIDPELLARYPEQVKTGLPGIAHLRLNAQREWPPELQPRLP